MAATEIVQGSAGRMPMLVEKIEALNSHELGTVSCLSCFPTCVSHSEVMTNRFLVNPCSKLETASGPNVPPLCETTMAIVFARSQEFS